MGLSSAPEGSGLGSHSIRKGMAVLSKRFHSQIDQTTQMMSLVKPTLTSDLYIECLTRLASVHLPIETAITQFLDTQRITFNWDQRKKSARLLEDLQRLTGQPVSIDAVEIPLITSLPSLAGYLYVIEGSTLGGSYIAANLEKTLNIGPDNGGAFFNVYGDLVDIRWDQLWTFIEAQIAIEQLPTMLAAAEHAFSLFLEALHKSND